HKKLFVSTRTMPRCAPRFRTRISLNSPSSPCSRIEVRDNPLKGQRVPGLGSLKKSLSRCDAVQFALGTVSGCAGGLSQCSATSLVFGVRITPMCHVQRRSERGRRKLADGYTFGRRVG